MLRLNASEFGKPIRFKNSQKKDKVKNEIKSQMGANAMVSQFLNVKSNYRQDLESIVGSDYHAHRYFCFDDCAYIFDIDIMRALIKVIESNQKQQEKEPQGCVVLFQGLRKSHSDGADNKEDCPFGRPTLIASVYVVEGDTLKHVQITQADLPAHMKEGNDDPAYDGIEHPGNGNSGTPPGITKNTKNHPKVVHKNCEDEDTDYGINTLIYLTNDEWK